MKKISFKFFHKNENAWSALLFLVLVFVLYFYAIHSDFIFDDNIRIADARAQNGVVFFEFLPAYNQGLSAVLKSILPDRPVLMASLWLNFSFFGPDALSFKLTNLLLHFAVALFFSFVLQNIYEFMRGKKSDRILSLLLGLVFLVHPLNVQAVTVVVQRGVLLSALCSLVCLYLFLRSNFGEEKIEVPKDYSLLIILFFLVGLLSKSNIIVLPLILLFVSFVQSKIFQKRFLKTFWALIFFATLPGVFYFGFRDNYYDTTFNFQSWVNYGFIQCKVFFFYLEKFLLPVGINANYPISKIANFQDFRSWIFFILISLLIGLSVRGFLKKSISWTLWLIFLISLVPESSIFPIPHVVFDHRMYFPMLFLLIFLNDFFQYYFNQLRWLKIGLISWVVFLSILTMQKNYEVRDFRHWISSSSLKYKSDELTNLSYLAFLLSMNDFEEGKKVASDFVRIDPENLEYQGYQSIFESSKDAEKRAYELLMNSKNENIRDITRVTWLTFVLDKIENGNFSPVYKLEECFLLLYFQKKFFSKSHHFLRMSEIYSHYLMQTHSYYLKLQFPISYQQEIWNLVLHEFSRDVRDENLFKLSANIPDLAWSRFYTWEQAQRRFLILKGER